ncbi:MAG: hypothetical protein QOK15_2979 [Nocardioidaceae bacterium]|nr:hypothetical protein [Nocardioidaceae bacterium]
MTRLEGAKGRPVVYLHIGAMKTGTTYLQQLMYTNRDELREAGVLLPGRSWGRQVRGVQDVMRLGRTDRFVRRQSRGVWEELLAEVFASPELTSVISVEFLSFAGRHGVRRVMDSLEGADVRVVLTVRDTAATLPSQWQTLVHNSAKFSWPTYLEQIPEPVAQPLHVPRWPNSPTSQFHRTLNVPRMLTRWRAAMPTGALHVVTVPPRAGRPDELWRRFAEVVGVDPEAARKPPEGTNPSLGYASTELVRQVNKRIGRLPQSEYNWTVKEIIALDVLVTRAQQEGRARLSRPAYDTAVAWNRLILDTIASTGAAVAGDLADLPVEPDPAIRDDLPEVPASPSPGEMLEAAMLAADALRKLTKRRVHKLRRAGVEIEMPSLRSPEKLAADWAAAEDPVATAAGDLASAARDAAMMLRRLREERRRAAGS